MKVLRVVKQADLEKERSEKKHPLADFLKLYNENLPQNFPKATIASLKKFQSNYPDLFKNGTHSWTLERHRKKFMDWLPQYIKSDT